MTTPLLRCLLVCLICLPFTITAQTLTIVIRDSVTQAPLPYANIYFKKSGVGISTNNSGAAKILKTKLIEQDTAVISYIGYQTKRIFILKNENNILEIQLTPSSNLLEEIIVKYVKPPNPKKIIRTALRNTKKNYSNQDVILKGLYRETIQENGKYIQLDEAITKTYYTSYPKKKMDRKIWKDWYYDDSYAFELDGSLGFNPLLKDFNTKKDQQTIVASRRSDNWSNYHLQPTLNYDPLLQLAFDKIKYQYDFFNPSLLRKYNFKNEQSEIINGKSCYVISFHPKETSRKFVIDQSKKNKRAIYIGRIYITKSDFALVKFNYKLAVERDYGFFANRMPLDYQVEMNYKKYPNFYGIDNIKFTETRALNKDEQGAAILLKANKEFYVLDIQTKNVQPLPDSSIFKSTRHSAIRFYKKNYHPEYWNTLKLSKDLQLTPKQIADLETKTSLSIQFERNKKEKKIKMAIPEAMKEYHVFDYHNNLVVDSLHWMALPSYEHKLKTYLAIENKYAKNELIEDKPYQKKLFNQLNNFFPPSKNQLIDPQPGSYFTGTDSLDNDILYFQKDSIEKIVVVNISLFKDKNPDVYIERFNPNPAKNLVMVRYSKVGIIGDFVSILPFGKNEILNTTANIYTAEWFSDTIFIYSKTNSIGRAGTVWYRNINTERKALLYTEPDPTFDAEVVKQNNHLLCTIQSKTENEIYLITSKNQVPTLEIIKGRNPGFTNTLKIPDGIYALVNDENSGSSIQFAKLNSPTNFSRIISSKKDEYFVDFLPLKDKIVAVTYEKAMPKIKYLDNTDKEWREINLKLGIGQYTLYPSKSSVDSLTFTFSSPAKPPTTFCYKYSNQNLTEVSKLKLKNSNYYEYTTVKRLWAKSSDGTKIPITILGNKAYSTKNKGLILNAYGAYGANTTPSFSAMDAVMMRQGYTIAYAHVRGESILGPSWYKSGREFNKKNSIVDYLASAEYLINEGLTTPNKLIGYGNSAGGIVVAQAINEKPELFHTVILDHAYLDVINTMMNDSLPLTIDEYKEWGNPQNKEVYDYILEYSPYQNIQPNTYPNVLFLASYQDYRTPIWQIAKHAAKLRANNLWNTKILLMTDMNSGHLGNRTGKEWIKEFAETVSFMRIGR